MDFDPADCFSGADVSLSLTYSVEAIQGRIVQGLDEVQFLTTMRLHLERPFAIDEFHMDPRHARGSHAMAAHRRVHRHLKLLAS